MEFYLGMTGLLGVAICSVAIPFDRGGVASFSLTIASVSIFLAYVMQGFLNKLTVL